MTITTGKEHTTSEFLLLIITVHFLQLLSVRIHWHARSLIVHFLRLDNARSGSRSLGRWANIDSAHKTHSCRQAGRQLLHEFSAPHKNRRDIPNGIRAGARDCRCTIFSTAGYGYRAARKNIRKKNKLRCLSVSFHLCELTNGRRTKTTIYN